METSRASPLIALWTSLALTASAVEPIIVKLGLNHQATALQVLAWKLVLGGAFMLPFLKSVKLPKRSAFPMVLAALLYTSHYALVFFALNFITVSILVTALATTPLIVALINRLRADEQAPLSFWVASTTCALGVILSLSWQDASIPANSAWGILLALLATLASATYRITMDRVTREIESISASASLFLINACMGLLVLPWIPPIETKILPSVTWIALAGVVANLAFVRALSILGSTRISVLTLLQRPLIILISIPILDETPTNRQWVGISLVLAGVYLTRTPPKKAMISN
jgi:drug/metabolite transporter (DMT)-like permease